VLTLRYCGFVLMDSWAFQAERRELDRLVSERSNTAGKHPNRRSGLTRTIATHGERGLFGRIEIARLGVSVIVIEGTTKTNPRRAVGHITGTALPGQPGHWDFGTPRHVFSAAAEHQVD
jgi:sortase (surface protein transpeptidase)